jgi:MFS family permease
MMGTFTRRPPLYYGWYIVATCFFIGFLTVGARNAFGIFVIPMSEEFGWNRTTISLAAATGFLVNGVTQPFLGHIFDKFGARKVILLGLVVIGLSTISLSFTFHFLFLAFMFGFVLSTALSSASVTNTLALASRWFRRKRATAMSITAAGTQAGGMLLVPFAMYLLQATNWRVTWAVLGMITLLLAVPLAYFFIRNDPSDKGLQPDGDPVPSGDAGVPGSAPERAQGLYEVTRWRQAFFTPPMWQLSASYVVCGITTGIISVHFVPLAIDRGVSPGVAATIFGMMTGLNVLGSILAGSLSDRFRRKNVLAVVYFTRGVAYVLLLAVPVALGLWGVDSVRIFGQEITPGGMGLWAFALVAGFSWLASVPLTSSLTADVYGLRALGAISGVVFLCHQIGSFVMILLTGFLYDLTGSYDIPFIIAGAFLFPAAISAFSIKEGKYSGRYQNAPTPVGAGG